MGWWPPWGKNKDDADGDADGKGKENENPPNVHGLADLARGMQHVAQSTQDILGQHFANVLTHYFDEETGEPIEKRLKLPGGLVLDIPLIALVPPSTLELKRLKLRMSVSLASVVVKAHKYDKNMKEIDRASMKVSFGPQEEGSNGRKNRKMMDIEMEFESREPPEMMNRILEFYTDIVQPQPPSEANKYGIPNRKSPDGTKIMHHGAEPPDTVDMPEAETSPALEPEEQDDSGPAIDEPPGVIFPEIDEPTVGPEPSEDKDDDGDDDEN